jgi:hypothetical protein
MSEWRADRALLTAHPQGLLRFFVRCLSTADRAYQPLGIQRLLFQISERFCWQDVVE